jgi:hypothetical protein
MEAPKSWSQFRGLRPSNLGHVAEPIQKLLDVFSLGDLSDRD